jgi:4-hydroxy-tetrahydrodipicolinate synthase
VTSSAESATRRMFEARGLWTAIVTPFKDGPDAAVDYDALDAVVDEQIRGGVDAVVPCGTTGESPTLTHDEHDRVVERVVKRAAGRVAVVAGTGSNSTAETLRLTIHAAESGADAAMLVVPYYNRPSQRMLFEHFKTVAERSLVPLVIYNIPVRTGVNLEPETIAELRRRFPKIVAGVKDATGSTDALARIRALCDVPVMSGDDALTLPMMALGATGVVSVAGNVAPRVLERLVRALQDGDFAAARATHERLMPLFRALFREPNPVPVKAALRILGRGNGAVRMPLLPAQPETESALRDAMGALGLLSA